jgi:hypothetical protein
MEWFNLIVPVATTGGIAYALIEMIARRAVNEAPTDPTFSRQKGTRGEPSESNQQRASAF